MALRRVRLWRYGRDDGAPSFPLLGKNSTGQLADAGWPVLYGGRGLYALHLHHATEAHEGHGKETR